MFLYKLFTNKNKKIKKKHLNCIENKIDMLIISNFKKENDLHELKMLIKSEFEKIRELTNNQ